LGFPAFVADVKAQQGDEAWLFPAITPLVKGGLKAWSKWINRYIDQHATTNVNAVFHSLRHNLTDALRRVTDLELRQGLVGHSQLAVHGGYGAQGRQMLVDRFGLEKLTQAINSVSYTGLDLSGVRAYVDRATAHKGHKGEK
jgi:hypothetical protein